MSDQDTNAILDSVFIGIIIVNLNGQIAEFNPAAEKIFGYRRDEVVGKEIADAIVLPESREAVKRYLGRLPLRGKVRLRERRRCLNGRRSDGSEVPLQFALSLVVFRGSQAILACVRDVTAWKTAERRATAQYAATRALGTAANLSEAGPEILAAICRSLEWSVGILWEFDRQEHALRFTASWEAHGSRTQRFVRGSATTTFLEGIGLPGRVLESASPAWVVDVQEDSNFPRISLAHQVGLRAAFAFPIVSDGGVLGVMEFFSTVREAPDRDLLDMLGSIGSQMGQFIERKRNEDERRKSEQRIRRIIDTSLEAVVTMDAHGIITGWNPQAEVTFGWQREEAVGRRMSDTIIPPEYRTAHERGLQHFMATGEGKVVNKRIEISALRRDGQRFPIELAICPLQLEDGWAFSAFIRDITERKENEIERKSAREALERSFQDLELRVQERTEELHKAKESAERASRAKSEFLANMSHEIRTPLNGVIGMTGLLMQEDLTPDQREYAQMIKTSGEALLSVVNDILDFSKIEAGKFELESIDFEPRAMFEEALELVAPDAHRKNLELTSDIDAEFPLQVEGDPARLRQILLNLLSNAVKFTERGEVKLRACQQLSNSGGTEIYVEVCDTGIGISEEVQSQLFQSFTQADSSTTRKYGGTGLGLAICKELVQRMGGRIGLVSQPGHGSTFWFTLRLPVTKVPHPVFEDSCGLEGCRVLVADDNETNRRILCTQLKHWKLIPHAVEDGPAALRALLSASRLGQPFNLAIVDFMMPVMDGAMLIEAIRSQVLLSGLPIILLTSARSKDLSAHVRSLGAACLTKPARQKHLLRTIRLALGRDGAEHSNQPFKSSNEHAQVVS